MKKMKIVALVMAVVMLSMVAVSCVNEEDLVVINNVTVSVVIDGETKFGPYTLNVEGDVENVPTVLDALQQAFIKNEINSTVDASGYRIDSVTLDEVEYKKTMDESFIYGWVYTANGQEITDGNMGTNLVVENDVIVLEYVAEPLA